MARAFRGAVPASCMLVAIIVLGGCAEDTKGKTADLGQRDTLSVEADVLPAADLEVDAAAKGPCDPSALVKQVESKRLLTDLAYLTGLGDRRSHGGQTKAAAYLQSELAKLTGLTLTEQSYAHQGQQYVNLIATIPGSKAKNEYVFAGAHYDAYSDDPLIAPGADDNASGATAVLEAARVLSTCQPERTVRLLFFSNGHAVGSTTYVKSIKGSITAQQLVGFINVDMVAFGQATEDLDLVGKPVNKALAGEVKAAVEQHTSLKTKEFISNHCG